MVNTKADSEASVEVLTYVSPSKVAKGKRKRRAAHYITSPYDVASLRHSMRLTFPQGTQKFDPFSSVRDCIIQQYKQFMESSGKSKIYIDSIKAGKKFFRLLEKDAAWIEDSHIEILTYLFRQRMDKYPSIFDRRILLLDCRSGCLDAVMRSRFDFGEEGCLDADISLEVKPDDIGFRITFNLGHVADISLDVKPDDIGFRITYNIGHVAHISHDVKPDDIGFHTTLNLGHVRRLTYCLSDKAPDVGPDICGSIILKISLSQALVYVTDVKPEDIGFDNSKDIVGGGS
ncbi:hypothetical protein FNV43_RR01211 [Rhamnella rubrinervis]|uniref:Uncharacterized protein n=1 Tax=Rhamnella rubrinervis TaxID=2594499 RepID=A0A8K0HR14_9ROSA|nr:hypothetical protein FNV43_RR01211 [Rhamnella rubrinervis]